MNPPLFVGLFYGSYNEDSPLNCVTTVLSYFNGVCVDFHTNYATLDLVNKTKPHKTI